MITFYLQREHRSVQLDVLLPTATTGLMGRKEHHFSLFPVTLISGHRKNLLIHSLWENHTGELKEFDSSFYVYVSL